jgi:wyosine [tRNA(Phe)-imidazoG37] synthetase (radical SAM superfamily)
MVNEEKLIAFGPVPSRRLGQSLGINNIPPKICTYSCIYCQLGRTNKQKIQRETYYKPKEIKHAVDKKIKEARRRGETIDYLTFVPDGEPTLDINLGKEIEILKTLDIRIAVITNASLLWKKEVKDDLSNADCVSLKIDTVNEKSWKKINRPHRSLNIGKVLSGLSEFSRDFHGELITETMFIRNINDNTQELEAIADFIEGLIPRKSYISIPTRPPAEKWATSADEFDITMAYHIFKERGIDAEFLTDYEGNAFAFTGNVEEDLLSITSVHPMREEGVNNFLSKAKASWAVIEKMIKEDKLVEVVYKGNKFYMRKLSGKYHVNAGGESRK